MFVQLITGPVADAEALRRQLDRWQDELRPDADGYLGSTCGVADDGTGVLLVRFASEEAARANSDRPEQGTWWEQTEACFAAEPSFAEGTEVDVVLDGGSDDAGFVQIIRGDAGDREALAEVDRVVAAAAPEQRPEIIGGIRVWTGPAAFTEAVYFTSEEAARAGESQQRPPEVEQAMATFGASIGDGGFIDLNQPWLYGA